MDIEQVEALERIAELKRRGLLDDHEVEEAKREILGQTPATSSEVSVTGDPSDHFGAAASKRGFLAIGAIGIVVVIVALVLRDTDDKTSTTAAIQSAAERYGTDQRDDKTSTSAASAGAERGSDLQQKLKTPQDVLHLTETQLFDLARNNGIDLSDPSLNPADLTRRLATKMLPPPEDVDAAFQWILMNHFCQVRWMGFSFNQGLPLPTFDGDYPPTSAGLELRARERACQMDSMLATEILRLHNEGDTEVSAPFEISRDLADSLRKEGYLGTESSSLLRRLALAWLRYAIDAKSSQTSIAAPWAALGVEVHLHSMGPNGWAFEQGEMLDGFEDVLYTNPYLRESFDQLRSSFDEIAAMLYPQLLRLWLASKGTHLVSIDVDNFDSSGSGSGRGAIVSLVYGSGRWSSPGDLSPQDYSAIVDFLENGGVTGVQLRSIQ